MVLIAALPASLLGRLLPGAVRAADFSGSFWHGAAAKISVNGIECGAAEWELHPAELFRLHLGVDLRWVKGDFALAASAHLGLHGIEADSISGGGTLEDIAALTGLPGWHGTSTVAINHLSAAYHQLNALQGDINVADLRVANLGEDINLGAYTLHFNNPAADAPGVIEGQIQDTAGPLEVHALLTLTPRSRLSTLRGTARERPSAPPALRQALEDLAQLRPRDAQNRIPLEMEFTF
jgi:hypothetical protein